MKENEPIKGGVKRQRQIKQAYRIEHAGLERREHRVSHVNVRVPKRNLARLEKRKTKVTQRIVITENITVNEEFGGKYYFTKKKNG